MKCPRCGGREVRTSRLTHAGEVLLLLVSGSMLRPFRCHMCSRRFWRPWACALF